MITAQMRNVQKKTFFRLESAKMIYKSKNLFLRYIYMTGKGDSIWN